MQRPLERIRAATKHVHERLEALPYSRAVLDGSLPVSRYVGFLRALWVLHGELHYLPEIMSSPALMAVFDSHFFERMNLIENDLTALGSSPDMLDGAALEALVLAQTLRIRAHERPAFLLGAAYVLEGSQLGNQLQRKALEKRAEFAQGGLRYLAGSGSATRARFQQFIERFEAALPDEQAVDDATAGAVAVFAGFVEIMNSLDPTQPLEPWLALHLNEDAGMHPVPAHVREMRAALRAGEQSYFEFAYYAARYGERGLRFTRSDSAWLVALSREGDAEQTLRQVHWLGRVLAARGMPRILLERHLVRLRTALLENAAREGGDYEDLELASAQLRAERITALPAFDDLLGTLPADVADEATLTAREAGMLLLGAVADERRGVARAVTSLRSWLCDSARFSEAWLHALDGLVARARASV